MSHPCTSRWVPSVFRGGLSENGFGEEVGFACEYVVGKGGSERGTSVNKDLGVDVLGEMMLVKNRR